jgi:hypothetical protein
MNQSLSDKFAHLSTQVRVALLLHCYYIVVTLLFHFCYIVVTVAVAADIAAVDAAVGC